MTATTTASPTSTAPTPGQVWTRARGILAVVLILVVAGITFAVVRSGTNHGQLDPRSADPKGSRAVAELLKARAYPSPSPPRSTKPPPRPAPTPRSWSPVPIS